MDVRLTSSNVFITMADENASIPKPEEVQAQVRTAVERLRKNVAKPINIEDDGPEAQRNREADASGSNP